MSHRLIRVLGVSGLALIGILWATNASSEPESQTPTKKSAKKDDAKKSGTANEGSPADLLKIVNARPGREVFEDPEKLDAFVRKVIQASKKVENHPKATTAQKDQAIQTRLSVLNFMTNRDSETWKKPFEAELTRVIETKPTPKSVITARGLSIAHKHLSSGTPKEDAVKDVEAFVKDFPKDPMGVGLIVQLADRYANSGAEKKALALLKKGAEWYEGDPAARAIQDEIKNLQIIGNPMKIDGPTLTGSPFKLESLKGKVVLVDFWATWCGPCVHEMPNVKAAYDKFHKQGFDVVGVSLDNEKKDLSDFVEENKIPWTQIIFDKSSDRGWSNPLSREYGIKGIPATFLIGRDGKVVARNLRGKALATAVEKELRKPAPPLAN